MIKIKFIVSFLYLFLFASFNSYAQYTSDSAQIKDYDSARTYFKSYYTDGLKIATAPFHWGKKDWIIAGSTVATASLIYIFDDDIRTVFQRNRSSFTNNLSANFIEPFGSGKYALPLLGFLYLYGELDQNPKSKIVALNGAKTFVLSAAFVTMIKQIAKRHRPQQDLGGNPYLWDGPFGDSDHTAFPSGHALVSFAMASYISSAYKDKLWVGIASYSVAGLVALSRLNDDEHWGSDVFVGAVLGYAIGKCVFMNSLAKYNIQVLPVTHTGIGLSLIKKL